MGLRAVCRANTGRRPGANDATRTKPASVRRAAGWPIRGARRDDASRRHFAVQQASRGLEGRQAARCAWGQRFLRRRLRRPRGGAQDRQERLRPHGQRAMSLPARPTAHLLGISTDLALCLFTTPLHGPSTASHPYDVGPGWLLGGKPAVCRQRRRMAQTPTDQEPAAPVGRPRRGQGSHLPSSQRGPLAPSPALHRSQPSVASAARLRLTCCCRPARQPYAFPETAMTEAWSCSANPTRRRRSSP
jgi:hypothetical protein